MEAFALFTETAEPLWEIFAEKSSRWKFFFYGRVTAGIIHIINLIVLCIYYIAIAQVSGYIIMLDLLCGFPIVGVQLFLVKRFFADQPLKDLPLKEQQKVKFMICNALFEACALWGWPEWCLSSVNIRMYLEKQSIQTIKGGLHYFNHGNYFIMEGRTGLGIFLYVLIYFGTRAIRSAFFGVAWLLTRRDPSNKFQVFLIVVETILLVYELCGHVYTMYSLSKQYPVKFSSAWPIAGAIVATLHAAAIIGLACV